MELENKQAFAMFCIGLMILLPATTANALTISDVNVREASDRYAIIDWTTDEAANSKVLYDIINATLAISKLDSSLVKNHSIMIIGLTNGTLHYFAVESSNANGTVLDNNSNAEYTFTTTIEDLIPPFIETSLPTHHPVFDLTVTGRTEPGAGIFIEVNGVPESSGIFADGKFSLPIQLDAGDNEVLIRAEDPSLNTNEVTYHVFVDRSPPIITYSPAIPSVWGENVLNIVGNTNEEVEITVERTSSVGGGAWELVNTLNATSSWAQEVDFEIDGYYQIKVTAIDLAGNDDVQTFDIYIDTTDLWIDLNPPLVDFSPAYITDQTIKGNTKPGATVMIMVNENMSESGVEQLLRRIAHPTGPSHLEREYTAVADDEGNFSIDIELSRNIKVTNENLETARRFTRTTMHVEAETGDAWINTVKVSAIDKVGNVEIIDSGILFARCGVVGLWRLDLQNPLPNIIQEQDLREGVAQFSIMADLEWGGPGEKKDVRVDRVQVYQQPLSREERLSRPKLDLSYELYQEPSVMWTEEKIYALFNLRILSDDFDFEGDYEMEEVFDLDAALEFPVYIEIVYSYIDAAGNPTNGIQKQCWPIKIDLERKLPARRLLWGNLNGTIVTLDNIVKQIDKLLKNVNRAKLYTFYGCIGTWAGYWITRLFYVRPMCKWMYGISDTKDLGKACNRYGETDGTCADDGLYEGTKLYPDKTKDKLEGCYSIVKQGEWFKTNILNLACDRIFCPAAPTIAKHAETFSDPLTRKKESKCEGYNLGGSAACKGEYSDTWRHVSPFIVDEWSLAVAHINPTPEPNFFNTFFSYIGGTESKMCRSTPEVNKDEAKLCSPKYYMNEKGVWYEANPQTSQVTVDGVTRRQQKWTIIENPRKPAKTAGTSDEAKRLKNCLEHNLGPEEYVFDPTSGIIASAASVCLPAFTGYLKTYRSMIDQIRLCLITVRDTGEGSSGLCNAVLTRYICDMVYTALRCAKNIFSSPSFSEGRGGGLGVFSMLAAAGDDVEEAVSGRYGSSGMFQTMFVEKQLINSVCLFAFTGDWDVAALEDLLTQQMSMNVDSTCVVYPATRRFITYNPLKMGKPTYTYHAGVMLAAGADLTYDVQLVCSADHSCGRYGDINNPGGRCDCFYKQEEKTTRIGKEVTGSLAQGDVYTEDIYEQIRESSIRYDKVRVTYTWTDNTGKQVPGKCELELNPLDEQMHSSCRFDILSGSFRCEAFVGEDGFAYFVEDPETPEKIFTTGEKVKFDLNIEVASPDRDGDGTIEISEYKTKWLHYEIKRGARKFEVATKALNEGSNIRSDLPGFEIEEHYFSTATANKPDVMRVGANSLNIAEDTFVVGNSILESFAVTFKIINGDTPSYKYSCYELFEDKTSSLRNTEKDSNGRLKIGSQFVTEELYLVAGTTIDCKGIKVKILGTPSKTFAVESVGTNKYHKEGDVIIIRKNKGTAGTGCTSETQQWTIDMQLWKSESGDIVRYSPEGQTPVRQERLGIPFNVRCVAPGAGTGTGTNTPPVITITTSPEELTKTKKSTTIGFTVTDDKGVREVKFKLGENVFSGSQDGMNRPTYLGSITVYSSDLPSDVRTADGDILKTGNITFEITAIDTDLVSTPKNVTIKYKKATT